jgi:hypothetical protein
MAAFRPTYITFDCYGTLIDFQMSHMTRTLFADRLAPDSLPAFTTDFSAYRFDGRPLHRKSPRPGNGTGCTHDINIPLNDYRSRELPPRRAWTRV